MANPVYGFLPKEDHTTHIICAGKMNPQNLSLLMVFEVMFPLERRLPLNHVRLRFLENFLKAGCYPL